MKTTRRIFLRQGAAAMAAASLGTTFLRSAIADPVLDINDDYRIVIGHNATEVETMAAETFVNYWEQISGIKLPIITDETAPMSHEIVLGNTNRLDITSIPANLRPQTPDGFVIYPKAQNLFIVGNTHRGTLYGVYDFLEQELGIRFLTPDLTHVPKNSNVQITAKSRRFDPVFEYRDLHQSNAQWALCQRLNGSDGVKNINVHLGGAAFIRPKFVHTFGLLVPEEKYFSLHPEYYALHDGKRIPASYNGVSGQLCLTNADVLNIMTQTTKEWLAAHTADERFYDPDELELVSISPNDNSIVCECPVCQKANQEEGCDQGTLMRAVNSIAAAIEKEYPNARIETLGDYSGARTGGVPKTPPRHNVLIRFATGDWDALQPANSSTNHKAITRFEAWTEYAPLLYTWNYHNVMANHFKPYPDLKYLGDHVRFQRDHNVRGYFSESTLSRRAAFADLRHYVMSRTLWRPDLETRPLIEEYCNLSYGSAAKYILEYVDTIDKHARAQNKRLYWTDGSDVDGIFYDYPFLVQLNQILQEAETTAPDAATKDRIAREHRLGLWYLMLDKGLSGDAGGTINLPIEWRFKTDPQQIGESEKWFTRQQFNDWEKIQTDRSWTVQGHDYHGTAWYALDFTIEPAQANHIRSILFGAVDGTSDLYLDGKLIHQRHDDPGKTWNVPFSVTLETPLSAGKHALVMRVTKESHAAGIWQPVHLRDPQTGLPPELLVAAKRFLEIAPTDPILSKLNGYLAPRGEEISEFVKRVNWMLQQNENPGGTITQPAAMLPNVHQTYTVVEDKNAATSHVVMQTADRNWTLGQSISWNITNRIQTATQNNEIFRLKVRVRLDHPGSIDPAFRFGYAIYNQNWSGRAIAEITVKAEDIPGDQWQWFTLPDPVKYVESERGMIAYVIAENNPQGVGKIYVDSFMLEKE